VEVISTIKAMEIEPQITLIEEDIRNLEPKVDIEPSVPVQVEITKM
jgi:hypothetical protein